MSRGSWVQGLPALIFTTACLAALVTVAWLMTVINHLTPAMPLEQLITVDSTLDVAPTASTSADLQPANVRPQ